VQVSLTVSPLVDADGAVIGASAVMRDVTERWTTRAALERAHARLERQRAALAALARSPELEGGDLARVAREITEAAGHTLAWPVRASGSPPRRATASAACDLYEAGPFAADPGRHSEGITL
jgi:hypothetical protein